MNIQTNLQSTPAASCCQLNNTAEGRGAALSGMAGQQLSGASMVESRSADITIDTMEGDRVTLSFSSQTQATYQVYNAQGAMSGAADARLETFSLSSGSEMTVAIEGELSDAEKADIEMVMSAIEEMAEEFFEGDVDEALAELLNIGEAKTLAGFQATLESSRSFAASYQGGAVPVDPGVQAVVQSPPSTVDPNAQAGRITFDKFRDFVSSMTGAIEGAGIDPSKAGKHMLKILDHLLDKISGENGFGSDKHKLAELVKSEFAGELNEMDAHEVDEAGEHEGGLAHEIEETDDERGHGHEQGNGHKQRH